MPKNSLLKRFLFFGAIVFLLLICLQPLLFHHEIIMLETGIHLPCMIGLARGDLPYKEFSYWRGPLELYVPYLMMNAFSDNMIMLSLFYYIFTMLTFICILIPVTILAAVSVTLIPYIESRYVVIYFFFVHVVMTKLAHRTFSHEGYYRYLPNKTKFEEVTQWILTHYHEGEGYESVVILKRNDDG